MTDIYDSPDYKRSRSAYRAQCTFEYFIALLAADAYLAKLLNYLGISDSLIGVISSLISFAFLFQLTSIIAVRKINNTKRTAVIFHSVSRLFFVGIYIIPFLPVTNNIKTILIICSILLAYFFNYTVSPIIFKWANSFVDPNKRGDYSAGKEMISLLSGMIFTLIVGKVIDRFEFAGKIDKGFLFIVIAGLIISICDFISLMAIKQDAAPKDANHASMREVIDNTFGNRNFMNVVVMTVLWDIGRFMTIGFLGIYKTKELAFSIGTVQLINIVGNIFRFFVSKPMGKYFDRTSYARGIKLALCIAALAFGFNIFTTPNSRLFIVIFTILYTVSIAGTNQNSFNILYSYVDSKYFVQASAIKNSIGGVIGFFASLVGSRILAAVQNNGNQIFGITIYGQQLLSAISFAVIIVTILFVHFVIERQKVMKQ